MQDLRWQTEKAVRDRDKFAAKKLFQEIVVVHHGIYNALTGNAADVGFLQELNADFKHYHWKDAAKARQLISRGMQMVAGGDTEIRPLLVELVALMPKDEQPTGTLTM